MSLGWYLRAHAASLACCAAAVALLAWLLPAVGVDRDPALLVCLSVAVLLCMAGLANWHRERAFMRELSRIADAGDDALDEAALIEEPGHPEGDLAAQALANVARAGRAEASRAREDMAAYHDYVEAWVHEVKAPIAAMRLFLENRRDPGLRPLAREVGRVDGYVEQALYYARSFSVERDYLVRPCRLDALVRDAVRSRSRELIEAHMAVGLDGLSGEAAAGGEAASPIVRCDAKWMVFILGQIVDNAVRYRADPARDGRAPRIDFSARVEDAGSARARTILDIRDNGCGIDAADLPRVFDRGFTGSNGRTHGRSTGMGLYLVATLCAKMGLVVRAASEPDAPGRPGWTRISIVFPDAVGDLSGITAPGADGDADAAAKADAAAGRPQAPAANLTKP